MMKLSDYVARHLANNGVRHVFMITGGGAMHLNDSFGREERIRYVCCHHEQACAIAAEGYARVSGSLGVINVTTGPGGINALNGVFGAWTDSVPMLVISGQVKRETCLENYSRHGLRQLGDQEADIVPIVRNITKYAAYVDNPLTIRYHLDRALHLATSGRPGPVWLDIPIDVQAAVIDEVVLKPYSHEEDQPQWDRTVVSATCRRIVARLQSAERPVILAGNGIRCARAAVVFDAVIRKLGIPVVLSRSARDLLGCEDPLYCGRAGIDADRAGNFVVQNADVLLVLGSRLGIRQISYNWRSFARNAYLIQVDVDAAELTKPTVKAHLPVHSDLAAFLEELETCATGFDHDLHSAWLDWCRKRVDRYPGVLPEHRATADVLNPYLFCEYLTQHLLDDDVVVCGNGSAFIMALQAGMVRKGQRWFFNSGCASMGYDLPAAVGAAFAREGKRVICIAGDGSIQMNIQELQTVAHHRLPVKVFVLNNRGYLSIRQTQQAFFGRLVGESSASGVSFPDMVKVAAAYDLPAFRIERSSMADVVERALAEPGPVLCDVMVDPNQTFEPRTSSKQLPDGRIVSPELEDMFPFLDREELRQNMPAQSQTQGG